MRRKSDSELHNKSCCHQMSATDQSYHLQKWDLLLITAYNALLYSLPEFLLSTCRFVWTNVVCNYVLLENCLFYVLRWVKKSCKSTYTPTTEEQARLPSVEFQFLILYFVREIIISLSGLVSFFLMSGKRKPH